MLAAEQLRLVSRDWAVPIRLLHSSFLIPHSSFPFTFPLAGHWQRATAVGLQTAARSLRTAVGSPRLPVLLRISAGGRGRTPSADACRRNPDRGTGAAVQTREVGRRGLTVPSACRESR